MPGDVNYTNAFIAVAEDCPVDRGTIPPERSGKPTIATVQFAMLSSSPYEYTSEDVLFESSTRRRRAGDEASLEELNQLRAEHFARPQACMRASPLPKKFGWGIHCDQKGRLALHGVGAEAYRQLSHDTSLTQLKALRSSRP